MAPTHPITIPPRIPTPNSPSTREITLPPPIPSSDSMTPIAMSNAGSANPSLRPDSTFKVSRTRGGTNLDSSTGSARAASVGARMTPISKAGPSGKSRYHAARALPITIANGVPRTSMRNGQE